MKIFSLIIFTITITTALCGDEQSDLKNLLQRMVQAYGGEENVRKLHSRRTEWLVNSPLRPGENRERRHVRLPGQLRVDGTANSETRIVNGDKVFRGSLGTGQVRPASGPLVRAASQQLKRLYTPLNLLAEVKYLRLHQGGGRIIIFYSRDDNRLKYFINKQLLIEKVEAAVPMPGGRSLEFATSYSDFKRVDGVLFPHQEQKSIGGSSTAQNRLAKIELGIKIDDKLFGGKPSGSQDVRFIFPAGKSFNFTGWLASAK